MNKKYRFFLLAFFLGILIFLSSCGPVTPFPTGTPTMTPTITRTPTRTPSSFPTKTPTATPYDQLQELGTLGEGILPQIVYSHDGQKAFLSDGHTLRVMDIGNNKEISSIQISEYDNGRILSTSPDDSLVVVDEGGYFRVIEIDTGKEVAFGAGLSGWAMGPSFTPDGEHIIYRVSAILHGPSDSICLLNLNGQGNDGEAEFLCNRFPAFEDGNYAMTNPAISPDGKLVAAGCSGDTQNILYIWDVKSKEILYAIKGQPSRINSVAFSPDGSTLATGSNDGFIRLWDPVTGQIKRLITGFVSDVVRVDFSPDGRRLIVSVRDQPTVSYELSTGKQEPIPPAPPDPLSTKMLKEEYMLGGGGSKIRFSPNGKALAVGHGSIQIWDVQSHTLKVALFADKKLSIAGMTYSPDGNHLAIVTVYGDVYTWDLRSGRQEFFASADTLSGIQVFYASDASGPGPGIGAGAYGEQSIAFSPDASQIALANGPAVEIWDVQSAKRVRILEQTQPVTFPTKVVFSADGQFVYAALNRNRKLAVWNAKTGKLIRQLNLPGVDSNVFTATDLQGPLFARNNYDDKDYWIEIWNIETGQMTKLPTHERNVEPLRFSADGKFFAALFNHNQLYIWRTDTGQLAFVSDADFNIEDLAISADGKLLATAVYGKATLWDIARYTSASFQPGFAPIPMPLTPTPWNSSSSTSVPWPTSTPVPTQVINPLPLPTAQVGTINAQNAPMLQWMGQVGKGTASQVTWSKVDRTILVSSSQGLYQLNSGHLKEISRFEPKSLWITSQQVLPDGRSLAAGFNADGQIQVWDVTNNKMLVELKGEGQQPAISPDGQWLVYENAENGLGTWNVETGQPGTILYSSYYLDWPVFSPDSKLVAAIQSDRSIRVWDLKTGAIVNAAGGPITDITDMSFSPDGHYILGAAGGSAWRWSMSPGYRPLEINLFKVELRGRLKWLENIVTAIASKPDNSVLAIGTSERTIWLYNTQTGQITGNLSGHGAFPVKMAFSPSGSQLLSVDKDGQIILWDVEKQRLIASTHEFSGPILGMTSRSDGAISAWARNTVWVFNPQDAELQQITYIPATKILAVSPAGDLVAGYSLLQVSLYNTNTGELVQTLPEEAEDVSKLWNGDLTRQFYGALFSPDGKRLATLGTGGVWMYTMPDGTLVNHWEGNNTYKAAFSPDGEWLVASNYENTNEPSLINFTTAKPIFSNFSLEVNQTGAGDEYSQYAVSPDKRWIALLRNSWDMSATLEITSTSPHIPTKKLSFQDTYLTSMAFNPTGDLIAIGRSDGKIAIVDFASLEVVATVEGHLGTITAITFSQDGRRLLSAGQDGTIKIWNVP